MKADKLVSALLRVAGIAMACAGLAMPMVAAGQGGLIPIPPHFEHFACYCFDPNDHVALSMARADCDSAVAEYGYPHGFVRPLTTPNYDGPNVCVSCELVEYACFAVDPPRRAVVKPGK